MSQGKRYRFFGSEFEVQTGFGSPKTVTAITAADPPVVSATAHGFVLGDVAKLAGIDAQIADTANDKNKRAVARGACRLLADEEGNRLLDPDNKDHVDRMAKLPLRVLKEINKAAELDEAEDRGN